MVVTFGFPCQDLSIAGKRRGLEGARSGLFFEAVRVIKELQPEYFVFENVKGLLTSNRGADFVRCLREIADLGNYDGEWQLVNTSWFLPQNRERIYFVGHLRGKSSPKVFPIPESNFEAFRIQGQYAKCLTTKGTHTNGTYVAECKQLQKIGKDGKLKTNQHLASCLTGGGHSGGNHSDMDLIVRETESNSQGNRVNSVNGNSVTLQSQSGGQGAKTGLYVIPRGNNQGGYKEVENCPAITTSSFQTNNLIVGEATAKGFVEIPSNCGVDLTQPNSKTRCGRLMDKNCNTLTTQSQGLAWYDGVDIRRLTPLECERLQGFPDGWTDIEVSYRKGNIKRMADSARYKALGNAVSVPIPEFIARALFY